MARSLAVLALFGLTACGGGGSANSSAPTPTPPPAPAPAPGPAPAPTPTPAPSPAPSPSPSPSSFALSYSTLLDGASGNGYEMTRDITTDDQGNIYLTGGTTAADFPTTAGAYDRTFGGGGSALGNQGAGDVFVIKMAPDGKIIWSTFLGGPNYDRAYAIRVGKDGSVYVAGRAGPGFPTTGGVVQQAFAGDANPNSQYGEQDGFVAKLSADGSRLLWSTYIGDSGAAFLRDMDVDAQGRPYLAVTNVNADLTGLITSNAWQKARKDTKDGAYIRLSADATRVEYGTYFGGSGSTPAGHATGEASIRVGADGSVVVASIDDATDFPATSGAYQARNAGGLDMIVMKFSPADQIRFATYLGGSQDETIETHVLALDAAGRIYLASATDSANFPTTTGAFQRSYGGSTDGFLSILSEDGSQLLRSTYIGGSGFENIEGINLLRRGGVVDAIVLSGTSGSGNLAATADSPQAKPAGGLDAFAAIIPLDLGSLRFLTFLGGTAEDRARASAVSADGSRIYLGGHTFSSDFPTTADAIDRKLDGRYAAWFSILKAQ